MTILPLQLFTLLLFILDGTLINAFQPSVRAVSNHGRRTDIVITRHSVSDHGDENDELRKQIDGGGDLTDRFKHKVHALMGTYDPPPGTTDDENQIGNIIGGLLQFPTDYTFSVVGKTNDQDAYANDVKSVMGSILGSEARMETRVVSRGSKFTRVSVKVSVESAAMITSIYDELDAMELTIMKF